ncbi:hypothetical protein GGI03_007812, partial [Coemansia sp. RSA 2337]
MSSPAQQPASDRNDIGDAARSSGLATKEDSEKQTLGDHDLEEPSSKALPRSSAARQQVSARYSTEEMLALRNSSLVHPPAHFSPYTPLRPGSQIKLPEIVPGDRDSKGTSGHATGGVAGAQAGVRHSISHDGGRLGATSWRSSGPTRVAASNNRNNTSLPVEDGAQPEWMADELTYDESQSAKKMQDIEEWKRRMKEGGSAPTAVHDSIGDMDHSAVDQQTFGMDEGAARGSRFLRMFSAPCDMADGS